MSSPRLLIRGNEIPPEVIDVIERAKLNKEERCIFLMVRFQGLSPLELSRLFGHSREFITRRMEKIVAKLRAAGALPERQP